MSKLMRISEIAAEKLESLSNLTGQSKQKILDKAVELYVYEQLLKKANDQYAAIKADPLAWKEMHEETSEWDCTLSDGLKND